jgi:hypothetical protein
MYVDKLDGRTDNNFFDRKAAEFRAEQGRIMGDIEVHRAAMQGYIDQGVRLRELLTKRNLSVMLPAQPRARPRA